MGTIQEGMPLRHEDRKMILKVFLFLGPLCLGGKKTTEGKMTENTTVEIFSDYI
jgi:hypothetical protein